MNKYKKRTLASYRNKRSFVKLGLYYSQDLDWHEEHGGGYLSNHIRCAGIAWNNNWDFQGMEGKDYVSLGDNEIPKKMPETIFGKIDMNDIGGFKPSPWGLYETAATLNNSWGY